MLPDCTDLFIQVETPKMPYPERCQWWEKGYWVDAQLNKINVVKMEDQHLLRVYQLIKKEAERRVRNIQTFYFSCPEPQGEMASLIFDEEFDRAMDLDFNDVFYAHPFISHLLEDVLRRGRHINWLKQFDLDAEMVEEFFGGLRATY